MEDTYPPNKNFLVQTISLIVPDTPGKTYYISIMFQDPYSNCYIDSVVCGYDDGDFTLAIEWLGVVYYARA